MANSYVQVPLDSNGKQIATNLSGGKEFQVVNIADLNGVAIAPLTDEQLRATPVPITGTILIDSVATNQVSAGIDGTDNALTTHSVITGETTAGGGSYVNVKVNPSGALAVDADGSDVSISNIVSQDTITQLTPALPVKQIPQNYFDVSFAMVGSGVQNANFTLVQTGSGMAVSQTGGNLVITTGTTANSETIIRSNTTFKGSLIFHELTTLSQRIANNNFYAELVDYPFGTSAFNYTIVNATTVDVTVTAHGFTAVNVGQRMDIGSLSSVGVPMEAVVASIPDANTIRFTVAGWPASGSGTCRLWGWNKYELLYTGTVATNVSFNTRRQGWQNTAIVATILTTASGHIASINSQSGLASLSDQLTTSAGVLTNRAAWRTNIPEPEVELYLHIRAKNGTTNPASTTTWTIGMVRVEDYIPSQVEVTALRQQSTANAMPVAVIGTTTLGASSSAVGDVGMVYRANATNAASFVNVNSPATPVGQSVKTSAGRLLAICVTNTNASARFLKVFNVATAPTMGTTAAVIDIAIPPNQPVNINLEGGLAFGTGIFIAVTGGQGTTNNTAVTGNEVTGFVAFS